MVGRNLQIWRAQRGLSLRALASALTDLGAPTSHSSLARVERGEIAATVDTLTAAAHCFGVSPASLLMPHTEDVLDEVALTGTGTCYATEIWDWLRAEWDIDVPRSAQGQPDADTQTRRFVNRSKPAWA